MKFEVGVALSEWQGHGESWEHLAIVDLPKEFWGPDQEFHVLSSMIKCASKAKKVRVTIEVDE